MNAPSYGVQQWSELDALWQRIRGASGWYVYFVAEPPPAAPLAPHELSYFIEEIDALLRREHNHDYCGIVYADNFAAPHLIKIFDPHHLGSSCGHGKQKLSARWILSRDPPLEIASPDIVPEGRKRWWRRLFGTARD